MARRVVVFFSCLCGLAALPAGAETSFSITRSAHETYAESVCANEFGGVWRVAD
ncbi:MAG: hypothetical protein LBU11_05825 [Zoogloeaceae bacterium]|nr:hypothetical protein [Zoogloeaceae bacterium]